MARAVCISALVEAGALPYQEQECIRLASFMEMLWIKSALPTTRLSRTP